MDISRYIDQIVKHRGTDELSFTNGISYLLGALLYEYGCQGWSGKYGAAQDGVVFSLEKNDEGSFVGHGIMHTLGGDGIGSVVPILIDMRFSLTNSDLVAATFLVGDIVHDQFASKPYTIEDISKAMLAIALSARPKLQIVWDYQFDLIDGVWSMTTLNE